jgi:hypothetical protein
MPPTFGDFLLLPLEVEEEAAAKLLLLLNNPAQDVDDAQSTTQSTAFQHHHDQSQPPDNHTAPLSQYMISQRSSMGRLLRQPHCWQATG